MQLILLARGRGAAEWFDALLRGDPIAYLILAFAVLVTGLICWLSFYLLRQKGQRLADGIGGCTYAFVPDGLFGRRFFQISGKWQDVPFSLEAHKTGTKGDHRTVLRFEKSRNVSWAQIQSGLSESREFVRAAHEIVESPQEVALIYLGVGGDPQLIKVFLGEVVSASKPA